MRLQISAFRFQILQGRLQTFAFPLVLFLLLVVPLRAQPPQPDWRALEDEIMRHYQTVLRLDTSNPPGNEHLAVEYLKTVFDAESIPSQIDAEYCFAEGGGVTRSGGEPKLATVQATVK